MSAGAEQKSAIAGFRTEVTGQYFGLEVGSKDKRLREYRVTVMIPLNKEKEALSLLKHKILPAKLPKAYPDFCRVRTIIIESMVDTSGQITVGNIERMDMDALVCHVESLHLPIDCSSFDDLNSFRETVLIAEGIEQAAAEIQAMDNSPRKQSLLDDLEKRRDKFAQSEAKRQAERQLDAELLAMNPDLNTTIPNEDMTGEPEHETLQEKTLNDL